MMHKHRPETARLVDLSHPITPEMPVWPGTPAPECLPVANIHEDGFAEQVIRFSSHTGTHLDAPSHMIEGGASLDRFPRIAFSAGRWLSMPGLFVMA